MPTERSTEPEVAVTPAPISEGTAATQAFVESAEEEAPVSTVSDEDTAYASSQGWVDRESYKGPANKWVDAGTFADRARNIVPIINSRNRALVDANEALKREIAQVREDAAEAIKLSRAQSTRDYNGALAGLRAQKAAAIDDADGAKVNQIEDQIAALERPPEPRKVIPPDAPYPAALEDAAKAFAQRNPWYGDGEGGDARKTRVAFATAQDLKKERADLHGNPAFFTELDKRIREEYPELFGTKPKPGMVDGGGRPAAAGGGVAKGFKDMPADAQEAAKRFVRNGWLTKEDDYAKQYFAIQEQA